MYHVIGPLRPLQNIFKQDTDTKTNSNIDMMLMPKNRAAMLPRSAARTKRHCLRWLDNPWIYHSFRTITKKFRHCEVWWLEIHNIFCLHILLENGENWASFIVVIDSPTLQIFNIGWATPACPVVWTRVLHSRLLQRRHCTHKIYQDSLVSVVH